MDIIINCTEIKEIKVKTKLKKNKGEIREK